MNRLLTSLVQLILLGITIPMVIAIVKDIKNGALDQIEMHRGGYPLPSSVCSLIILFLFFLFMYHTSDKNIQIFSKQKFFQILRYNGYMIEALLVYLGLAVFIGIFAVQEDRHHKKIADGFNPSARDGDKDGIVQD